MLRRLHRDQPESFAFTPANAAWAEAQVSKFPEGRQASAIIPLLWRAQEQEGWLTRPAIEHVAGMLGMDYIRALEVATFYFMFQLHPVGSVANIQICGTTPCMLCGAEDLVAVCREKIAEKPHTPSADGKFSWEEVECLGACANAPMAQIGKDYYEDLTAERLAWIIDELAAGRVPPPGPQNGRFASEPLGGLTTLKGWEKGRLPANASVTLATTVGDTVKRIDGSEVALRTAWRDGPAAAPAGDMSTRMARREAKRAQRAATDAPASDAPVAETKPGLLAAPKAGKADDLKQIRGVGPSLEKALNDMGVWHFAQIAAWSPAEVAWVDANLVKFKGRIARDNWVEQAKLLAAGGQTEFSERVKKGDVY